MARVPSDESTSGRIKIPVEGGQVEEIGSGWVFGKSIRERRRGRELQLFGMLSAW